MGLGDHPKTFLLKALCCKSAPSWLKVVGGWWWVANEILLSSPGTGGSFESRFSILGSRFSILDSIPKSQVPSPKSQSQSLDNCPSQLNRITCNSCLIPLLFHWPIQSQIIILSHKLTSISLSSFCISAYQVHTQREASTDM